jgi:hypothetical protein
MTDKLLTAVGQVSPVARQFFFCGNCQSEKPWAKRRVRGYRTLCTDCLALARECKRTGVYKPSGPYAKAVGHKQDSWASDSPIPDFILERHAESLAE